MLIVLAYLFTQSITWNKSSTLNFFIFETDFSQVVQASASLQLTVTESNSELLIHLLHHTVHTGILNIHHHVHLTQSMEQMLGSKSKGCYACEASSLPAHQHPQP